MADLLAVDSLSSSVNKPDLSARGAEEKENNSEEVQSLGSTRRIRGRPRGSKNKPKPSPNALRSLVMEIADRVDIVDSLIQFARKHQKRVCVLSATGIVTNVTLCQPTVPGTIVALHGPFEIISLTGSLLPGPSPPGSTGLTIHMAEAQGRVVCGNVVGPLMASGTVMIMAVTFSIEDDQNQ